MKKFFPVYIYLFLLVFSCGSNDETQKMIVTGKVKGLKKGTLYLQHISDTTLVSVDSLQVDDQGRYTFETEIESPEIYYLYLNKQDANTLNDRITFFAEPGTITINTSWNTFDTNASIEGSKTHIKLETYQKTMSRFNARSFELIQSSTQPEILQDSIQLDSLQTLSDANIKRSYAYALNFALSNNDSYIAPYIALTDVADANPIYLDSIYNSLTPEVSKSKYGKALAIQLAKMEAKN